LILSDESIRQRTWRWPSEGKPAPLVERAQWSNVQPASLDLQLGFEFQRTWWPFGRKWRTSANYSGHGFWMWPKEFMLGHSWEILNLPADIGALCSGTSTNGRKGLMIENAGWVDPGFCGQLTFELYNQRWFPLWIDPGQIIAQLIFFQTDRPSEHPYGERGRYQNQMGAVVAR
jgi:dCTP deaminase